MAFCSKLMKGIRKVMDQIDTPLGEAIAEITRVTKIIKDSGLVPADSKVGGWLNTAIDEITEASSGVTDLNEKLNEWLGDSTEAERNAKVFKLASVAAKVSDIEAGNEAKSELVYDTAVQARIIADK